MSSLCFRERELGGAGKREGKNPKRRGDAFVLDLQSEISDLNSQLLAKQRAVAEAEKKLAEKTNLESRLEKTQAKLETLQKELDALKRANAEKTAQIERLKSRDEQLSMAHETEIRQATKSVAELRQRNTEMEQDLLELEARNKELEMACIDAEKRGKKMKKKLKKAEVAVSSLNQQIAQVNSERGQLDLTLQTATEDAKTLKIERDAVRLKFDQRGEQIEALNVAQQHATASLDKLQIQMEKQQQEIGTLIEERGVLASTVQKLHSLLCVSESRLQDLEAENGELKKRKMRPKFQLNDVEIENLKIPFEGQLKAKVAQVLRMAQYQPVQRFQIVLNEIQSELAGLEKQATVVEAPCEKCKEMEAEVKRLREMLTVVVRGLGNLVVREKDLGGYAFCDSDKGFLSYMAEHCLDFEPASQGEFVPLDVLSGTDGRRVFLEKLRDSNHELYMLFNVLFYINTRLNDQCQQMRGGLLQKQKIEQWIDDIGVKTIDDIPMLVGKLIRGINRLKKQDKHKASDLENAQQEKESLEGQIVQLKNEVMLLKNENDALKTDLQINSNDHYLQVRDKTESSTSYHGGRVGELEALLESKTSEIEAMKSTAATLQQQLNSLMLKYQTWMLTETQLKAKNKELVEERQAFEQRSCLAIQKLRKKNKKLASKMNEIQTRERENMARQQSLFEASIAGLNQKLEQLRELSKQLSDSLAASEVKNQELSTANSELKIRQDEYAVRVEQLNQKLISQQRRASDMATAAMIEAENRMKNEFDSTRKRLIEQSDAIKKAFMMTIGGFYRMEDSDFSDDLFERLLFRVKSDLARLTSHV